jgi:hypothetical protein
MWERLMFIAKTANAATAKITTTTTPNIVFFAIYKSPVFMNKAEAYHGLAEFL